MIFAEPTWLIAGAVLIAALLFLYRRFDLRQRAALAEFASSHLLARLTASFSPARRWVKRGLFLGAVGFACIALARPQWGYHWVEEKDRGIDILFAIDTSKSMLTQDVNPDRLTRAKMAITDFVRKLDGDRVGLIAFAGEAFLQAPLTLDYDAFQDSLDSIDVNTIPRGGTDIGSAIQEAQAAFGPGTHNKKILVLVTDGEDLEGQGIDAARAAAKDGLVIYTVGVGTGSGGLIPVPNGNGGTDFVRDASGNFVKSHLDETTLSQIAEATGGMYQPLGQQGQGLGVIYDKALASMPKHDVASRRAKVYEEQYAWPLAAGLTLLLASMLIGTRRRGVRQGPRFAPARTAAGATALLALLSVPTLAHASAHSAESAYKKGQYDKAVSQFQDAAAQQPDVAPLQYDLGAAAYKSGQYDTALPAFQKALGSDDPALQQKAYYNIGNTEYRVGQKTVKAAPQETIKAWQNAVQSYDAALKLKADDADAKFNRDFVEKKLEKLEKEHPQPKQQQNQQQQQQQQQQDQQQQNQQNQQNQNQQQNQQNQNQQDQQNQQGGQQGQPNQNQPQNGQNQAQNQPKNPNGQQPPSAADPNKQNGQQPQQTAGSQDQKQGGQQKQDQQNGNGQQQQTAQNQPKDGGAKDQAASADKDKQSGAEADASLPAGELTKEQAKDLLNSLKGEEHILPVAADTRSAHPKDQPVLKDW